MTTGRALWTLLKHLLLFVCYGALGAVLAALSAYIIVQQQRPDLKPWHSTNFDLEFKSAGAGEGATLNDYLQVEDVVFRQLDEQGYSHTADEGQRRFNRFSPGSLADPRGREPDWNRTFLRIHPDAQGAVLLLHGLSDSPYSMRAMAEVCYAQGLSVLVLRLPGHGLAPAGLLQAHHTDWMAAVRLAMRHLAGARADGQPVYIVGYSTGAALAVEYAAARLLGEDLPAANGLILLSPAIGVSSLAAFAIWQSRLAALPGLEKLAWTDILPEYDPYKYNSFPVTAGDQVYRLTERITGQFDALATPEGIAGMPPVLAFQSVADATVSAPAVLNALFLRLTPGNHELVAFDINRRADIEPFLNPSTRQVRTRLLEAPPMAVDFTLVVNASPDTQSVVALRRAAGTTAIEEQPLDLAWPPSVYSLSHVALPFPPDDPIYGASRTSDTGMIFLGQLGLHGERGLLAVSADGLLRLRHNPFFSYVESRTRLFLAARLTAAGSARGQDQPERPSPTP